MSVGSGTAPDEQPPRRRLTGLFADTRPLRTPDFRRLWLAHIVTVIGAQLTVVAVPAQIYIETGSSAFVGLTGVFGLVPLVVFGLYGGVLADAFDRRIILLVTSSGLIVTSALFWIQAMAGGTNVWLLLCLFSVQQAFFAVQQPTRTAVLPRILEARDLPAGLALNFTVSQVGAVGGPLIAGILIPFIGLPWLYFIDTLTLAATLVAVIRLPPLKPLGPRSSRGPRAFAEALRYLRTQPILVTSLLIDLMAMTFGMPRALFPEIAHVDFGGPLAGGLVFALLFAAIPIGAVLGGVLSGWVSGVERQGRAVIIAVAVWGASILGFGIAVALAEYWRTPMIIAAIALLMIGGAADMISAAFRQTILVTAASDHVRGRLQGVSSVFVNGGPRVADALHGVVAVSAGTAATAAGGGAIVVIGAIAAALLVPAFVRYRASSRRRDAGD